jgi:hypothetical protein
MAQNDAAVLTAAKGFVYLAPADTATPADTIFPTDGSFDLADIPAAFIPVGHTSRDELPEFGFDGGDTEVRGSWQNESLRQVVTESAVDFVTFQLLQFDQDTLALYYGGANAATVGQRRYQLNSQPGGITRKALLIVVVDGDLAIAFYAPRVDLKRDDAMALATDEFGALPMRATLIGGSAEGYLNWIGGELDAVA